MLDIKDLKSKVRTLIEQENILRYLDIVANNPGLSYLNQMFLFFQSEKAEVVCGRGAWMAMERTIKDDAKMLHMIYPAIVVPEAGAPFKQNEQTKFDVRYLVIGVYGLSDTEGKEIPKNTPCQNFLDRIAIITQSTPEITDKPFGFGTWGEYDTETDIFYLSKNCPDEKKNEVLLSVFIDYVLYQNKNTDKELRLGLRYVVFKYFQCDTAYINAKLFGLLKKRTDNELILFFRELQFFSWKIINELQEVPTLNFDETAFVNELLNFDNRDDLLRLFDNVIASIDGADPDGLNDDIKEELTDLRYKLSLLDEDNIQEMYIQKQRNRIFSYPATPIRYDLTKYLERK